MYAQVHFLKTSVSDPHTIFTDPDPGFYSNMDPDPDPGKKHIFLKALKIWGKIILLTKK